MAPLPHAARLSATAPTAAASVNFTRLLSFRRRRVSTARLKPSLAHGETAFTRASGQRRGATTADYERTERGRRQDLRPILDQPTELLAERPASGSRRRPIRPVRHPCSLGALDPSEHVLTGASASLARGIKRLRGARPRVEVGSGAGRDRCDRGRARSRRLDRPRRQTNRLAVRARRHSGIGGRLPRQPRRATSGAVSAPHLAGALDSWRRCALAGGVLISVVAASSGVLLGCVACGVSHTSGSSTSVSKSFSTASGSPCEACRWLIQYDCAHGFLATCGRQAVGTTGDRNPARGPTPGPVRMDAGSRPARADGGVDLAGERVSRSGIHDHPASLRSGFGDARAARGRIAAGWNGLALRRRDRYYRKLDHCRRFQQRVSGELRLRGTREGGRVGWPLRRGAASVVIYRDGIADIGRWEDPLVDVRGRVWRATIAAFAEARPEPEGTGS